MAVSQDAVDMTEAMADAIKKSRARFCYECGRCTGICPVARYDRSFSPRSILVRAVRGEGEKLVADVNVWSCLTCKLCDTRCPAAIDYGLLTKTVRSYARREGAEGMCTHGGAVQSLMRIMTSEKLSQDRLGWVDGSLKTKRKGDTLFFVGCTPYFDVLFSETGAATLEGSKGAIKLMNAAGVAPVLLPNERCCGHDLLWNGEVDNFRRLAQQNLAMIEASGAKRVIVACPEGYVTLKVDYPDVKFKDGDPLAVTFQDPCRLGRHSGIYDAPRKVLEALPGVSLREMPRSRERAICCGVGGWMNCTSFSKMIQEGRLREARATGADVLVTACPKCEVHLKCALSDKALSDEVRLTIVDFAALAASRLA